MLETVVVSQEAADPKFYIHAVVVHLPSAVSTVNSKAVSIQFTPSECHQLPQSVM